MGVSGPFWDVLKLLLERLLKSETFWAKFSFLPLRQLFNYVHSTKIKKFSKSFSRNQSIETAGFDLRQIVMPLVVILCKTASQVLSLEYLSDDITVRVFKLSVLLRYHSETD